MDIIGEEHQFSMISRTVGKVSTKPPKGGFFMYYINVEGYVVPMPRLSLGVQV